ncbi:helix-turn-helix domain-containing protein [Streptomyces sp. NPDC006872]|uniref:AraC-like ligand-binding domain-containing protein n=1 Tax=Streptomyces sp. NPDC006872 TaxID=3155720 RepID=UPI0033E4DA3B
MPTVTTPRDDTSAGRFEFWREVSRRSFVPLEAVPGETSDFHASLHTSHIGAVQVSVVTAQPHGVTHTLRHIAADQPDFVKVSLQLSGRCRLNQGDRQALLNPGELAVYDTRHPYTLDFDLPYRMLVLMFSRALLRLTEQDLTRVNATTIPCREGLGPVVQPFLRGLARQVQKLDHVGEHRLANSTVDLVGALLSQHGSAAAHEEDGGREALRQRILTYMEQRLADPELGPDRIAEAHHISRRYLYKLLAEQGHTVSGWIRERRLTQCRRDLADPALAHLSVGAVGGRWGFPDAAHFSHVYKAAYGMPPGQTREAAQQQ